MKQKKQVYLDNNATTLVDPRVIPVITEILSKNFANPSSIHAPGRIAKQCLNKARQEISAFLKVLPSEIIFTSGGTEALNMVLKGFFFGHFSGHIVTSNVEHSAVFESARQIEKFGCEASFLSPGAYGAVSLDAVKEAVKPNTRMIALMAVNNETGVKTDISAIAAFAKEKGIFFLVDGVALLGKELFSIPEGVSAMCFSGHKFHAPKGVGFVFIRRSSRIEPFLTGGGQEFEKRGGTENLPGIAGMGEAVRLLKEELPEASQKMQMLRDRLENALIANISDVLRLGEGPRIVNTSNLAFAGVEGESLLAGLDLEGISVSHGSACASGALEPSRILLNMGIPKQTAGSSIRFSLSRFTTEEEIDIAVEAVSRLVKRLR